eukprot:scaffold48181_cov63-Phaeocystis_antarctica.AAC.6
MSAVVPKLSCRSTLAPRFSSILTTSRWPWAAAACSRATVVVWPSSVGAEQNASTGPPLSSHLATFCSSPRSADSKISRGRGVGELITGSPASGGAAGVAAAGGGACCWMRSAMAGGVAAFVEQLGVGLGLQQRLHARLLPFFSGHHQGGSAVVGLQIEVGRVLQQDEHDREVAVVRSIHERCDAEFGLQVDARASHQQHPHDLQVAVGCGVVQQGFGCVSTVSNCARVERIDRPSLAQPLDHLLQLASPGRVVDLAGQRGGRAHRGLASVRWGGRRNCSRRGCCVLPGELRGGRLAHVRPG